MGYWELRFLAYASVRGFICFKDPKVADRRKSIDRTEVESFSGSGWVRRGVSAATGGSSCAGEMDRGCGGDGDGLVDIAKCRRDHGPWETSYDPRTT